MDNEQIKHASLGAGVELAYGVRGTGPVPVICIPGYSLTLELWERFVVRLPASCRSYCYDLRGFGGSSHSGSYDLDTHAADLDAFMDVLDIDSAVIVAHSLGGTVAQIFSVKHPERVRSLILVGSRSLTLPAPDAAAHNLSARLAAYGTREQNRAVLEQRMPLYFGGQNLAPGDIPFFVERTLRSDTDALRDTLVSSHGRASISAGELNRIRAPVLIVSAAEDPVTTPAVLSAYATVLARSETVLIPDCGHGPMWEKPEQFTDAVIGFLERNKVIPEGVPAS